MAVQETRQKSIFFRAENLGYTNNRPSLSSTHRSVSPSGELSNGDGSPVLFLYLLLGIGSFPFSYLLLTHRSFRLHLLTARECKRIHFNGNISTVRFISTTDRRTARATLERARVRAPSYERAAELGTFVSFFFFRLYTKLKHDHNRTTIHDFNLHQ